MNKKKEGLFKGASVAELYSKFGVVLILILCLIIGTILSPEFLTGSNLMSVARTVGVYAIIALGMTRLLIGGGVDLSAGSNVAFCSVIVAVIYAQKMCIRDSCGEGGGAAATEYHGVSGFRQHGNRRGALCALSLIHIYRSSSSSAPQETPRSRHAPCTLSLIHI